MRGDVWEDMVSLHSHSEPALDALPSAAEHRAADRFGVDWAAELPDLLEPALAADTWPLPPTAAREGYYGPHHFSYWASGLRDMANLLACCDRHGVRPSACLDLGCASGRVVRHFAVNRPEIRTIGCDINRHHVAWIARHLPARLVAFHSCAIPTLPIEDNSLDLVSAFSVFTHIEAFETAWLMEIRRVLRPGGLAWITVHTEKTWAEMTEGWPLYKALKSHPDFDPAAPRPPMREDRRVFRWRAERSYSSNVFYRESYVRESWGRIMEPVEFHRRLPGFQDVFVFRK